MFEFAIDYAAGEGTDRVFGVMRLLADDESMARGKAIYCMNRHGVTIEIDGVRKMI